MPPVTPVRQNLFQNKDSSKPILTMLDLPTIIQLQWLKPVTMKIYEDRPDYS